MAIATPLKKPVYITLAAKLYAELRAATVDSPDPYAPTLTQVMERGVVLALKEMKQKAKK